MSKAHRAPTLAQASERLDTALGLVKDAREKTTGQRVRIADVQREERLTRAADFAQTVMVEAITAECERSISGPAVAVRSVRAWVQVEASLEDASASVRIKVAASREAAALKAIRVLRATVESIR